MELSGTTFMNSATYSCNDGYSLNGDNLRECNASGHWVPDEPTCECTCRSYPASECHLDKNFDCLC